MKLRLLGVIVGFVSLVETVGAEAERSAEAVRFHVALGARNAEADYVAMEEWVFAKGMEDAARRKRVEEGGRVLTDRDYRQRYDNGEKEQWVDRYLACLEEECGDRWWAWLEAAEVLDDVSGTGVMVGGEFQRGRGSWNERVYAEERDEAMERQALMKALELVRVEKESGKATGEDFAEVCVALAETFPLTGRTVLGLTDLDLIPEISDEPEWRRWGRESYLVDGRAPVIGEDGGWRLPELRESFEEAVTDGERVYWLLNEAIEATGGRDDPRSAEARLELALMWSGVLGVDGLVSAGYIYLEGTESEFDPEAPGEFELHTLKDHETIMVGADGPERRVIPEHCRYLEMLRGVVEDEAVAARERDWALAELLEILADRYQYAAVEELAREVLRWPDLPDGMRQSAGYYLEEIAPDMKFVTPPQYVVGRPVVVEVVTRGVDSMRMELWKLNVEKLLEREGMMHNRFLEEMVSGESWRWGVKPEDVAASLPYFEQVARWREPVRKKGNHMQTVGTVTVPVQAAGKYVVVAEVAGERRMQPIQVARTIVLSASIESGSSWRESGEGKANLFLVDAVTGRPVEGARVMQRRDKVESVSDHQGLLPGIRRGGPLTVHRGDGVPELLEVEGGWLYDSGDGDEIRSLFVTNQPLYRPGQEVEFAGWLKRPEPWDWQGFEKGSEAEVRVTDPVGIVLFERKIVLDEFDGFAGRFKLPDDMVLGECEVDLAVSDLVWAQSDDPFADDPKMVKQWEDIGGSWTFEVGEFRKPDFRVVVEPDTGGEQVGAVVRATYNSGEPVKGAKAKVRVSMWPTEQNLFPKERWDDLYGSGYDWSLPRTPWLEGWGQWGVRVEQAEDWDNDDPTPSERVVFELQGETDEHGEARLEFPALPEGLVFDCDLRVGVREFTGRSLGAEAWFFHSGRAHEVFLRPERRFYREGETVRLDIWTMDAKREAVAASGALRLETIRAAGERVDLKQVWEKELETGADGRGEMEFVPPGPGQYRCVFASGGGERAFVLEVLGEGREPGRYDGVQVIPEKAVLSIGEKVEVLVQTEQDEATVWLFEQMPDGQRRTPRLIRTRNQQALVTIPVTWSGVPEFYLLAATVVDGRLKKARCRIVVPPVETHLDVAVVADPAAVAPGGGSAVEITVTDDGGAAVEASLAVTAFDRALEELGGALPTAGRRMRECFEGEAWPSSSPETVWRNQDAIIRLEQPGIFFERRDIGGDPRWGKASRFELMGLNLWVAYEPPELPNSIGGGGGFGVFPVTPASPTAGSLYAPIAAEELELSGAGRAAMEGVGLRKNLADRAYWGAALRTGEDGKVRAAFALPDNLTTWKVQSWAFGRGNRFGDGQAEIVVSKDLQVRPLLPRAMVVGDELFVGAMVQNLSERDGVFQVVMEAEGVEVDGGAREVRLAAGVEGRAEWKVRVKEKAAHAGLAVFRFRARSGDGKLTDGTEVSVPVAARRVPVTSVAQGDLAEGDGALSLNLKISEPVGEGQLKVRVEGHPALGALAVLPDLVSYPHGCAEQTLNRFLPTLIAWQAADELKLDWTTMQQSLRQNGWSMGWISGRGGTVRKPPALTEERVRGLIMVGLNRLQELQSEGGWWGWFSPQDRTEAAYLTALAVRGMARAGTHGFKLEDDPVEDGVEWLRGWASAREAALAKDPVKVTALDAFVVHVLAEVDEEGAPPLRQVLLASREHLDAAGLTHLALSMDGNGGDEVRRLFTLATEAMDPVKAGLVRGNAWWQDEVELRAWYLKLLVKVEADAVVLRSGIRGLLDKRTDGVRWKSTRDSALCVEAIIEAALACDGFGWDDGETRTVVVAAAGGEKELVLSGKNLWSGQVAFPVDALAMSARKVPVVVRGDGTEALNVAAALRYESASAQEMQAEDGGIAVARRYFRVTQDGKRSELKADDVLRAGELVEVELRMKSPRPRSFVHLRDPIPAGLEPLVELSGYEDGAYRESRTGETHFFMTELRAWNGVQRYYLRAVTRGLGLALPARGECMYAPAVFGQSGGREMVVE